MFSNLTTTPDLALEQKPYTEVRVDTFGRATIEGKNFKGTACTLVGEALRRAIGGAPSDTSTPKPEMFEDASQAQDVTRW